MLDEWNKVGLDGLITPVSASVALKHGTIQDCLMTMYQLIKINII